VKTRIQEASLRLDSLVDGGRSVLFSAAEAEPFERGLLKRLDALATGSLLVLEFDGVRVSSEAARQLLSRALKRVAGGELEGKYLVLSQLGPSKYNVDVMLKGENLTVAERLVGDPAVELIGRVDTVVRDTFEFLVRRGEATAREVAEEFDLDKISAATNRLTTLSRMALAIRVDERPVSGGGREYVYSGVG